MTDYKKNLTEQEFDQVAGGSQTAEAVNGETAPITVQEIAEKLNIDTKHPSPFGPIKPAPNPFAGK